MTVRAPFAPEVRRGEGLGMRGLSFSANHNTSFSLETRPALEPGQALRRFEQFFIQSAQFVTFFLHAEPLACISLQTSNFAIPNSECYV